METLTKPWRRLGSSSGIERIMQILAHSCNSRPAPTRRGPGQCVLIAEIDNLTKDRIDNEKDEIIQLLTEPSPHLSNTQVTNANLEL